MSKLFGKLFQGKDYSERGKKIMNIHKGKYTTYQKYLEINPAIAEQYLQFIGKHPDAVYIRWDKAKSKFTM